MQQNQDELRQEQPFLSTDQWQKLLYSQKFLKVASFPEAQEIGQHIIIAQTPASRDLPALRGFTAKAGREDYRKIAIEQENSKSIKLHPLLGHQLN